MIAEKIKELRYRQGMTQSDVANKLGITRSGVNAWGMGVSVPSTQYIVELARIFNVSSDYILDIQKTAAVNVSGLSEKEVGLVKEIIDCLKNK